MAITYPLTLPAAPVAARRMSFRPRAAVASVQSPFTFDEQIQAHQGQLWVVDVEMPPIPLRADAEPWAAFKLKLNGRQGTFLLGDHTARTPRGSAAGAPAVDGGGQTGQVLNTKGWTPSATGVLLTGDYFQLGSGATARLHKVLNDADADSGGLAALDIWPRLRESPADSAVITTTAAVGVFRMAGNVMDWEVDAIARYGVGFTAVEAL